MFQSTITRRQLLRSTGKAGIAITLASAFAPSVRITHASPLAIPDRQDITESPEFQEMVVNGLAPLWVAGQTVNSFAYHLKFVNMPPNMVQYFRSAGGDWKSLWQAKAIWETIPAQVRAGGPREVAGFLGDMDWSHRVARQHGGSSTEENGIFETRILNRIRGGKNMTPAEVAAAKQVIQSKMIGSVVRQTVGSMVTGAMVGIIIAGLIICLECGLLYAEGKITWEQMVEKVIKASLLAGGLSIVIAGLIVGLALLFPAAIAMMVPLLFVLQIVSLVFFVQYAIKIGEGYWKVLKEEGMLEEAAEILDQAENYMRETVNDAGSGVSSKMREWTRGLARWVGWKRARATVQGAYDSMGVDQAWTWLAARTELVGDRTSDLLSPLKEWGHIPKFDVDMPQISMPHLDILGLNLSEIRIDMDEMKKTIANVINVDFRRALGTTVQLKGSLDKYIAEATSG